MKPRVRCSWAGTDPLYIAYHDTEWGVPQHDDRHLFEMLVLEGAQAGLRWITILRKRQAYKAAFDNFEMATVAAYNQRKQASLLRDPGIVRNRLKIEAAIKNARVVLAIIEELGSFDAYLWRFVDGKPRVNRWRSPADIPARTPESDVLSRDLRQRGCSFVGSTICYAFMQAVGLVNDHVITCFRHGALHGGAAPGPVTARQIDPKDARGS